MLRKPPPKITEPAAVPQFESFPRYACGTRAPKMLEILVAFGFALVGFACERDTSPRELGEREFLLIKAKSTMPRHGACWHDALRAIESSCDKLNDREHSILALRLANCFLDDSGHVTYSCHELANSEESRRECINAMSDRAFGVYNEFYTHTTHMCSFLHQEAWQSETENTIKQLSLASSRMKEQLLEATELQNAMLQSQKEGLQIQNELLDNGRELGTVIKSSAETVGNMVVDFRESAADQKELLNRIFSNVQIFQDWIMGEVSWFQSIVYYTVSCILCALFSSSRRTADARVSLFAVLSFNVVLERMLVQYYQNATVHSTDDKISLVRITWLFRKAALTLCFSILLYAYYGYKDEQRENYRMLRRIECRLDALREEAQPVRYSKRLALRRLKNSEQQNDAHPATRADIRDAGGDDDYR